MEHVYGNRILSLNGEWELREAPRQGLRKKLSQPLPAKVPGDVILTLLEQGVIEDPLLRDKFRACQWIGERDWHYRRSFEGDFPEGQRQILVFEGLAYKASVYLNGELVGTHKNMHRPLRIDISRQVRHREENLLELVLCAFDLEEAKTPVISWWAGWSDAIASQASCLKRGAGRKADYSYGWDWTQGLPLCGIWRDVFIESTGCFQIRRLHVKGKLEGAVRCAFQIDSVLTQIVKADALLLLRRKGCGTPVAELKTPLVLGPGEADYALETQVASPSLWFPAGYGEQPLYEAELRIEFQGLEIVRKTSFAFRSFQIEEERLSEKQGTFKMRINGASIFARGANWIPPDIIPARTPDAHYRHLLTLARMAGINYLRFWGGGIYERELFYDLCDEYGILLWHDFLFSGPEVPDFDSHFRRECLVETEEALLCLRHHPSIVVWCGSNETDDFYEPQGGHSPPLRPEGHYYGYKLFHQDFPDLFSKMAMDAVYIPSCPTTGTVAPEGTKINAHGFGTTHRNLCQQYASDHEFDGQEAVPAFMNEVYGVSPDPEASWTRYLSEEDVASYNTPVLDDHNIMDLQRNEEWSLFFRQLCFDAFSRRFELPIRRIFDFFTEAHCELVKRYTEFLRRKRPLSGGIAFWMFNSAYTMHGWALVDYYGVPKAAFYAARRAFQPLLPVIAIYDEKLVVYVSNDTPRIERVTVDCKVCRYTGTLVHKASASLDVEPGTAGLALEIPKADYASSEPADCLVIAELTTSAGSRHFNHRFLAPPRERRIPNADVKVRRHPSDSTAFLLQCDSFASRVEVLPCDGENYPDDNAFDLLPGEEKVLRFSKRQEKTPELRWANRERGPYVVASEKRYEHGWLWALEIFNPSANSVETDLHFESTEILCNPPRTLALPPRQTLRLTLELFPKLFLARPCNCAMSLTLGKERLLDALELLDAEELQDDGLTVDNRLPQSLQVPEAIYSGHLMDGQLFQHRIPAHAVAPGEHWTHPIEVPSSLLPFSCGIELGGRRVMSFWEPRAPFRPEMVAALPQKVFAGSSIEVLRAENGWPDFFRDGKGIAFQFAENMKGTLFLHRYEKLLFLTVFLNGVPMDQPHLNEWVYQGSCLELSLATTDNLRFRDYSLAKTSAGNQLYLRRGNAGFRKGLRNHLDGELSIFHFDEAGASYYNLSLDTERMGMSELLQTESFTIALRICWPDGHFDVFSEGRKPCGIVSGIAARLA